jgi:hypothetical protein
MSVFKGSKGFYEYEISGILAHNLKSWIDYGLLELGAYTHVKFNLPTSGYTNLKRVKDDRYTSGRVYEGFGPSWAWESGVNCVDQTKPQIFQVSGVYINGSFYPSSTTGQYAHKIDYRNGRIVFTNALPSTANVQCEYVMRDVDTFHVSNNKWRTIVEEYSKRFDDLSYLGGSGMGMASTLKENRVWLPSIAIQVEDITNAALQLGGGEISTCQVSYHIFSDKSFSAIRLCDLLMNQKDKTLNLYDVNKIPKIYEFDGSLGSGSVPYPTLSDRNGSYFWTYAGVDHADGDHFPSVTDLYRGEVSHTIDVQRYLSTY